MDSSVLCNTKSIFLRPHQTYSYAVVSNELQQFTATKYVVCTSSNVISGFKKNIRRGNEKALF